jgi:hypothetical protein
VYIILYLATRCMNVYDLHLDHWPQVLLEQLSFDTTCHN